MALFSLGLGSTLVLGGTLHLIMLAASGITTFSHSSSDALQSMDDFIHCVVMVLARGISGTKGAVG